MPNSYRAYAGIALQKDSEFTKLFAYHTIKNWQIGLTRKLKVPSDKDDTDENYRYKIILYTEFSKN